MEIQVQKRLDFERPTGIIRISREKLKCNGCRNQCQFHCVQMVSMTNAKDAVCLVNTTGFIKQNHASPKHRSRVGRLQNCLYRPELFDTAASGKPPDGECIGHAAHDSDAFGHRGCW